MLAASRRGGALTPDEYRRLERGLRMSSRTVRQMMAPRSELFAIEVTTPPAEVLEQLLGSPYSRVPIYQDTLDHILGAVSTKELAGAFALRGELPPLAEVIRPIPFVPETLKAHRFVRMLQEQQHSKAIVVDEFGGVQGIISIEDVLTRLFGDIGDELKPGELGPERLVDGSVRLPGDMGLDEAEPWLGTRWEGPEATVGGHVVAQIGRLPTPGERFEVDGVDVTVTEMAPTAIRWMLVHPRPAPTPTEEEG